MQRPRALLKSTKERLSRRFIMGLVWEGFWIPISAGKRIKVRKGSRKSIGVKRSHEASRQHQWGRAGEPDTPCPDKKEKMKRKTVRGKMSNDAYFGLGSKGEDQHRGSKLKAR